MGVAVTMFGGISYDSLASFLFHAAPATAQFQAGGCSCDTCDYAAPPSILRARLY